MKGANPSKANILKVTTCTVTIVTLTLRWESAGERVLYHVMTSIAECR